MKTKKVNKVLALNKRTMANLNNNELRQAFGGVDHTDACRTNEYSVCPQLCPDTDFSVYPTNCPSYVSYPPFCQTGWCG